MPKEPIIFLSFANDPEGIFLDALEPERKALKNELALFQRNGWGYYHSSPSSAPKHLVEDLQLYPRQISIFHFSGHSDGVSLQLERPDGEAIHIHGENISAILHEEAQSELKLVFLNACETSGLIDVFQEIGVPAIIATNSIIDDTLAKEFSVAFYRSLLGGSTLETAFKQAQILIETEKSANRIFPFETRGINWGETDDTEEDTFAWGLYHRKEDKDILSWRLLATDARIPQSDTKALNDIPGSHQDFVGRDKELRELRNLLQKEKPVLLLNGIGGIGKTTLARQYLHDNYFHFDHVVWVSVLSDQLDEDKGFQTATEALGNDIALMNQLGMDFDKEQSAADRAGEILSRLRTQTGKNLLVIDNAGFSLEDIRKDLPKPPNWQVLITSRKELSGLSVKRLDELPPEEALELFYLHYPQGKRETKVVEALLEYIGYHTLTLELFAKTCQKSPNIHPGKILKLLQEKRLEKMSRKVFVEHTDREVEVYSYLLAAFELHELSEKELSVLIQWAILPPLEIPWNLLCQIFTIEEESKEDFEGTLMGLQQKGWIAKGEVGETYRMHQLIQEILRIKHKPGEDNCEKVIQGIQGLLHIDQSKDNPIDKFPFVLYGESVLGQIKEEGNQLTVLQNNLALVYKDLGDYERASGLLELALAADLNSFGDDHPSTARSRSNLALVYKALGDYGRASGLFELALASNLNNFGEDHPSTAISRSNLALVYKDLGEYGRALGLLELALASNLNSFGEDHPSTAIIRSNLALVYQALGDYKRASDLLELALVSNLSNFGEDHPSTAIRRSNLALVYQALGDYERATSLLELALTSNLNSFGEDHPYTAISRSNLARVYQDLGDYERALGLLELALASDLNSFGEDHPSTAISRSYLANVYQDLGEYERASELLELALASAINSFGEDHPSTAIRRSNLALVYKDLGDYERASDLLELALASDLNRFGEDHPATARNRSYLASVYQDLGDYERASGLFELALVSDLNSFGEIHPYTAGSISNLAGVYMKIGKKKEAKELFKLAYKSFLELFGVEHPNTKIVKQWLDKFE